MAAEGLRSDYLDQWQVEGDPLGGLLKAKEVCARAFILPLRDFQRTSYLVSDMLFVVVSPRTVTL